MSSEQEGREPFEQQQQEQLLSIEDKDDSNEPSSSTKDIVPETNPWHSNLPCFFSKQDIEAVLSLPPHIQNVRLQLIPSLASDPDLANVAYIDAEFLPQRAVTIGRGTFESLSHTSRFDLSYISRKHARLDFQQPNKL
jgi:pSer/pThr/pTyr-binding forkhead associated (FHA) protein